jgi:hypothetical protein
MNPESRTVSVDLISEFRTRISWKDPVSIHAYSEKYKGALQNPSKRFFGFPKVSKCVPSLKKTIKTCTEPFEGSAFYPLAEPFLTEPFLGSVQQKKVPWENTKPWGFCKKPLVFSTEPFGFLSNGYWYFTEPWRFRIFSWNLFLMYRT